MPAPTTIPSQPITNRDSRSPSPGPAPPIILSPGPRATALQKVFNDALAHTLKACSYGNFSACFPTPAKYVPESLDGLHRDFVSKLDEVCKNEFAALMEERAVVTSLNELDDLVADAKRRKERAEAASAHDGAAVQQPPPIAPHLLPPSSLLAAHLAPFLSSQAATFSAALTDTQSANKALLDEVTIQRAEIEALVRGLEDVVLDLEGAVAALAVDEMQGLELQSGRAASTGMTAR